MFSYRCSSALRSFSSPVHALSRGAFVLTCSGVLLSLASCGGSDGEDGDFSGAGRASISVSPSSIDIGDQTRVRVRLDDINDNGIIVKIRLPEGLRYVPASGLLTPEGDEERELRPDVNDTNTDEESYIVFFLNEVQLDDIQAAEVSFEMEGNEELEEGQIEVDIDVDDRDIPNNVEFDIENPEFQAEDASRIDVIS